MEQMQGNCLYFQNVRVEKIENGEVMYSCPTAYFRVFFLFEEVKNSENCNIE